MRVRILNWKSSTWTFCSTNAQAFSLKSCISSTFRARPNNNHHITQNTLHTKLKSQNYAIKNTTSSSRLPKLTQQKQSNPRKNKRKMMKSRIKLMGTNPKIKMPKAAMMKKHQTNLLRKLLFKTSTELWWALNSSTVMTMMVWLKKVETTATENIIKN